jgi:hypothetical protein
VDVRKVDLSIELQILAFHAQRRAITGVGSLGEHEWQDRRVRRHSVDGEPAAPVHDDTGVAAQAVGT